MNINEIYENLYESQSDNITEKKKLELEDDLDNAETSLKYSLSRLKNIKPKIDERFKTDEYLKSHIKNGVNAKKKSSSYT